MSLIILKFSPDMEQAIIDGRKCCTIRDEPKGKPGDLFVVKDRLFRILKIDPGELGEFIFSCYDLEGFTEAIPFRKALRSYYPGIELNHLVYLHFFAYVCDICPDFNLCCNSCIPSCCPGIGGL